jgi:hypothetical protein
MRADELLESRLGRCSDLTPHPRRYRAVAGEEASLSLPCDERRDQREDEGDCEQQHYGSNDGRGVDA